jgi:hypothetical protein
MMHCCIKHQGEISLGGKASLQIQLKHVESVGAT